MKLKEIHRTSTFAWSPHASVPLLATGTVAGALDESFSNESQLEIWAPAFLDKQEYELGGEGQSGPKGTVTTGARFNKLAWGFPDATNRPSGVIASGMDNGELAIWDPDRIVAGHDDPSIFKNSTHTGPVRGLDFNPIQPNLLGSGAVGGEIFIWNMLDPSKPYSPGAKSNKLEDISALAWNNQVAHVLASASTSGYTVVWDLRHKREVVALTYGAGGGPVMGGVQGGLAYGARRGMSDVAWHPENATRLVTSSEDDASPVIMVWDLRNARAPEKILTGHEKGVLSLSWCKQDPDLLLSSGKDNRALCWNPQTSEIIGELPSASNWAFQVDWCPRNPDLLATAFFDGTIGIHSIQSPADGASGQPLIHTPRPDGADVFDDLGSARHSQATFSLKQPPKWLRRPVSASFGYGGRLVSVSNLPAANGTHQSGAVHLRTVVTEEDVVERATKLRDAEAAGTLSALAEERSQEGDTWKALLTLFRADSRDELITLLGFSKADIAAKVAEAVEKLKAQQASEDQTSEDDESTPPKSPVELADDVNKTPHEPVVSFAEPEASDDAPELTPSEVSASATSDAAGVPADGESTTTAPSLFGDDVGAGVGTPQLGGADADFFSTIGLAPPGGDTAPNVPHTNYGLDSSVAATIGSGPSSVASERAGLEGSSQTTFRIYPAGESETDRLVTRALVVGDFDSAVALCLGAGRYADAILLAARGGPELLQRTQTAYFAARTAQLPYLRLFQSVVTNDLADVVQNADLAEWTEIFVVLCTFARGDEFAGLAEQLGRRLEFAGALLPKEKVAERDQAHRNAMLAYLAAGRLERLVALWTDELAADERSLLESGVAASAYAAHARALGAFVEKVALFRAATRYADKDMGLNGGDDGETTFRLAALYDRYVEYADLLATQGALDAANAFVKLVPPAYASALDIQGGRERIVKAASKEPAKVASTSTSKAKAYGAPAYGAAAPAVAPGPYGVPAPTAPAYGVPPPAPTTSTGPYGAPAPSGPYGAPAAASGPYGAPPAQSSGPYGAPPAPTGPYGAPPAPSGPYGGPPAPSGPYGAPAPSGPPPPGPYGGNSQYGGTPQMVPPPRPFSNQPPPPSVPIKRDAGGWNDAPTSLPERRTPAPAMSKPPSAITAPFPGGPTVGVMSPTLRQVAGMSPPLRGGSPVAPPPRPGSRTASTAPPPPQRGHMNAPARATPPPPAGAYAPPQPPLNAGASPYSPQQSSASPYAPQPPGGAGSYAPPPNANAGPYGAPPPGPAPNANAGPYRPQQSGPYAPPPGAQGGIAPPPGGPPAPAPPAAAPAPPPKPAAPAGPKYPPGDRSHIPSSLQPAYSTITGVLGQLRTAFPAQKRLLDDVEKRLNPLFDAMNCETLPEPVVEKLLVMTQAMRAGDKQTALEVHVDMLTSSMGANISGWMSGLKQLIQRM
ncbi:hypothetical protein PENSPDRAFT_749733 [Peniophora sp. CONT]|nr:hypothetical protein PENSPDRAFT_749733 [Peniophora sp. CONT]